MSSTILFAWVQMPCAIRDARLAWLRAGGHQIWHSHAGWWPAIKNSHSQDHCYSDD